MSTNVSHPTIATARTVVADPNETIPAEVGVEPGGTVEWTNPSDEFPQFEILFDSPSPVSPSDSLTGTTKVSVTVTKAGTFPYRIMYIRKDGSSKFSPRSLAVRSCVGC